MGTRGYRVIRFRGRYYCFYNHYDSYPENLGNSIVHEIPTDPTAYQQWLIKQRWQALKWDHAIHQFLCRPHPSSEDDVETDDGQIKLMDEYPWGIDTETLPDFKPGFNNVFIEWVYTIDLDKEVFTVNNGAHFKLDQIPRGAWINAMAHTFVGDTVVLPGSVPKEAIADLVVKPQAPSPNLLIKYNGLEISIVEAKGLGAFYPTQRHGPLLRAKIFNLFEQAHEDILSTALLSWTAEEMPFREIAYAILCLASTNQSLSLVRSQHVSQEGRIGHAHLRNMDGKSEAVEFLAHLGVGCHLEGLPLGSSPEQETYWFDGALIHIVAQLSHGPEVVHAAVSFVSEYCQSKRLHQCVDAVLLSIEHLVLMRIYPGGRVEHTELLPLFDIGIHTSRDANGRYPTDYLDELQKRKERAIKKAERDEMQMRAHVEDGVQTGDAFQDEQLAIDENEEKNGGKINDKTRWPGISNQRREIDKPNTNFIVLMHFLKTSFRQQMTPVRSRGGIFPTEIYHNILLHVEDSNTYQSCMQVSRTFYDLCQENFMVMDGIVFQANDASKNYDEMSVSISAFRMKTLSTGDSQDVVLKKLGKYYQPPRDGPDSWQVVLGREYNRRSLLPNLMVSLLPPVEAPAKKNDFGSW